MCSKSQEYPILGKNTPCPPAGLELLMEDLGSSGLRLVKNTPPGLELLMEDLVSLGVRLQIIPPPPLGFELLMEDLVSLGVRLPIIPPPLGFELPMEDLVVSLGVRLPIMPPPNRIGTSHGGLRKFRSDVGQEYPVASVTQFPIFHSSMSKTFETLKAERLDIHSRDYKETNGLTRGK